MFNLSKCLLIVCFPILISCVRKPILLVMSFDGFRSDYISEQLTPNLYSLARNGVRGHMLSNFVTKTYPNHQSIATGFYPENHGIVSNGFFDPKYNLTFDVDLSPDYIWTEAPVTPVWTANEMNGGNSGVMNWIGGHVRYRNHSVRYLHKFDAKKDREVKDWNRLADIMISWMKNEKHPANCIFSYWDEPDTDAHNYGPFHPITLKQVGKVDQFVARLLNKLKRESLFDRTNLVILSDHGMAEVNSSRVIYLDKILDLNMFDIYGGSPVRSILPKPGFETIVYQKLKRAEQSMPLRVYRREDIPKRFHYNNNRRILPIFVVTDIGWDLYKNYDEMKDDLPKGQPIWGNHGWDNLSPAMRPLFIASGPEFKTEYNHKITFINSDLFPLFLKTLNISLNGFKSDSVFRNVENILK